MLTPLAVISTSAICFGDITLNILRPRQNGHHFADNIFKYISWMEMYKVRLRFHLYLFLSFELDYGLAPSRWQAIIIAWYRNIHFVTLQIPYRLYLLALTVAAMYSIHTTERLLWKQLSIVTNGIGHNSMQVAQANIQWKKCPWANNFDQSIGNGCRSCINNKITTQALGATSSRTYIQNSCQMQNYFCHN